ncbi:MAG: hypothetical protein IJH04_03505 [Eggerthellaceae bacterium]|nr:hypothetical protein [Eggerthellaceae bacterium]
MRVPSVCRPSTTPSGRKLAGSILMPVVEAALPQAASPQAPSIMPDGEVLRPIRKHAGVIRMPVVEHPGFNLAGSILMPVVEAAPDRKLAGSILMPGAEEIASTPLQAAGWCTRCPSDSRPMSLAFTWI